MTSTVRLGVDTVRAWFEAAIGLERWLISSPAATGMYVDRVEGAPRNWNGKSRGRWEKFLASIATDDYVHAFLGSDWPVTDAPPDYFFHAGFSITAEPTGYQRPAPELSLALSPSLVQRDKWMSFQRDLVALFSRAASAPDAIGGFITLDFDCPGKSPWESVRDFHDGPPLNPKSNLRGYYWGTLLGPTHLAALADSSDLRDAPVAHRESVGECVYLQLSDDLRDAPDPALAALRDFLQPLLADAPLDPYPATEPYRILEAPVRASREWEIPPLRPLSLGVDDGEVDDRPLDEMDGDVVVVAQFEQAKIEDVRSVIEALLDAWYEEATDESADPAVHNMGASEYVARREHVEMNVWLDVGSATDQLIRLVRSIEQAAEAHGWHATVTPHESYET